MGISLAAMGVEMGGISRGRLSQIELGGGNFSTGNLGVLLDLYRGEIEHLGLDAEDFILNEPQKPRRAA